MVDVADVAAKTGGNVMGSGRARWIVREEEAVPARRTVIPRTKGPYMPTAWKCFLGFMAAAVVLVSAQARATTVMFGGGDSYSRSAVVEFEFSGSDLYVTLTNDSATAAQDRIHVLTAVFFDLDPSTTLTPVSALLAPATPPFYPASLVYENNVPISPQPVGGVVGGEWAYRAGIVEYNNKQGISSAGLGLFGPKDNFPGSDLGGPDSVDGVQYGIVGPAGIATTNASLRNEPLIQNAVVFRLSGVPDGVTFTVENVVFQYGTDLDEPHFIGGQIGGNGIIPEPMTVLSAFLGICGLGAYVRRRIRAG